MQLRRLTGTLPICAGDEALIGKTRLANVQQTPNVQLDNDCHDNFQNEFSLERSPRALANTEIDEHCGGIGSHGDSRGSDSLRIIGSWDGTDVTVRVVSDCDRGRRIDSPRIYESFETQLWLGRSSLIAARGR